MKENSKDILEKIKKLMAHQQSAMEMGSIEEANAFACKIQNMMNKYNLSIGELDFDKRADEIMSADFALKIPSIGGRTNYQIYNAIAKNNWCKVYIVGSAKLNRMIIVGTPENIEICKYIHSVVTPIFLKVGKESYKTFLEDRKEKMLKGIIVGDAVGLDTYMRTFILGCEVGLDEKLIADMDKFVKENSTEEAIKENGCSALVIVKGNEVAIKSFVENKFGNEGKARASKVSNSGGAFGKGVETGKNVSINKGVATSNPIKRKMIG